MGNPLDSILKALAGRRANRQIMERLKDIGAAQSPAQLNGHRANGHAVAMDHVAAQEHFEEAFLNLQSNLRLIINDQKRVFLITSATPQEGKSTIAVNLARSLGHGSKNLLLVDADLRQPSIHRILGLPNRVGFTDLLMGKAGLFQVLHSTYHGMVLTSGPTPANPEDLLRPDPIIRVLTEMRRNFDLVIMDSPPVLTVADTALLASHLDGALLVLKFREVRKEQVEQAKTRLESVGAKVIGCVINYMDGNRDELAKF